MKIGIKAIILILLISIMAPMVHAEEYVATYYGVDTCINCKEVEAFLKDIESELGVVINKKNLANKEDEEEFIRLADKYGVETSVPAIVINNKMFIGVSDIKENLKTEILSGTGNVDERLDQEIGEIYNKKYNNFSLGVIIAASLLDGVNPCAIAMLLFFMSILINMDNSKNILKAGISYTFAIFLTYLGIGLGILEFIKYFTGLNYVLIGVYIVTMTICIYLIYIDTKDYINIKSGNFSEVKNELPKGIKHKIQNILRGSQSSKWVIGTTFITGIAVALLEFSCTGQVYIPTITFILSQGDVSAIMYLLIYNIGFVMPIVIITFAVYKSKDIFKISNMLIEQRKNIKLASIVFYSGVLVYFTIQISKLI